MITIRGYITNLGKYNGGELIGEWVTFPVDEAEFHDILENIGINDKYEEYFFTDWDTDINYDFGEYPNIEEVNEIAERIDNISFKAISDDTILAAIEECDTLKEALDVLEHENFVFLPGVTNIKELGEQYAEESGDLSLIPDELKRYFDFEKYGDDIFIATDSDFTSYGYFECIW